MAGQGAGAEWETSHGVDSGWVGRMMAGTRSVPRRCREFPRTVSLSRRRLNPLQLSRCSASEEGTRIGRMLANRQRKCCQERRVPVEMRGGASGFLRGFPHVTLRSAVLRPLPFSTQSREGGWGGGVRWRDRAGMGWAGLRRSMV